MNINYWLSCHFCNVMACLLKRFSTVIEGSFSTDFARPCAIALFSEQTQSHVPGLILDLKVQLKSSFRSRPLNYKVVLLLCKPSAQFKQALFSTYFLPLPRAEETSVQSNSKLTIQFNGSQNCKRIQFQLVQLAFHPVNLLKLGSRFLSKNVHLFFKISPQILDDFLETTQKYICLAFL